MEEYYWWKWNSGEVPENICKQLIEIGNDKWESSIIQIPKENKTDIRKSDVVWLEPNLARDSFWSYMEIANHKALWKYNITDIEACQLTRYKINDYYDWHKDQIGSHGGLRLNLEKKLTRKLSMSVILNSDFEGAKFEFFQDDIGEMKMGSIITFPSFMDHRITPVTKGIRYSLVIWFLGPPFV